MLNLHDHQRKKVFKMILIKVLKSKKSKIQFEIGKSILRTEID